MPDGAGNGDRLTFYKTGEGVSCRSASRPPATTGWRSSWPWMGRSTSIPAAARSSFKLDDRELLRETYAWQDGKTYHYSFKEHLTAGDHRLSFEIEPLTPAEETASTSLDFRIVSVKVQGPLDPKHWTRPRNYERFFPKDEPPQTDPERREYAREVLAGSRPRPSAARWTTGRSTGWWRSPKGSTGCPGQRFEQGVARAMVAVLASPRFVFRVEATEPNPSRPARRILSSTNMPWRRGSPISSGRPCPTTSCSGWPSAAS